MTELNMLLNGYQNSFTSRINEQLAEYRGNPYSLFTLHPPMRKHKAHLSVYPLSKNIRMVASVVAKNLAHGWSTQFSDLPRRGEEDFVRTSLGWESWFPWVWTSDVSIYRGSGIEAWSEYFEFPNFQNSNHSHRKLVLKYQRSQDYFLTQLPFMADALRQTFTFSQSSARKVQSLLDQSFIQDVSNNGYIGVHIRRGENVSEDEKWTRKNVPFVSLEDYATATKDLAYELGIDKLFVSTDSVNTLERFSKLCTGFNIFYNYIDRSQFFRPMQDQIEDVETHVRKNGSLCNFYAFSALADLYMLSGSKGLVGTISKSEFSKTAWYLAVSKNDQFVPFRSLSGPLDLEARDGFYMV